MGGIFLLLKFIKLIATAVVLCYNVIVRFGDFSYEAIFVFLIVIIIVVSTVKLIISSAKELIYT